jgi:ABC-type branched-subunit amino acid transport system ATPase component
VEGVSAGYRGVPVLHEVTFEVGPEQVVGLVGPNGAGKSTLLDVVCGTLRPTAGRVYLFDRDVTRLPTHRRARLGLGRTFQRLEPFSSLSIADNLLVAVEVSRSEGQPEARQLPLSRSDGQPEAPQSQLSRSDGQPEAPLSRLSRSEGQSEARLSLLSRSEGQSEAPPSQLSRSGGQPDVPLPRLSRSSGQPAATVHGLLRRFGLVDFADQPLTMVPTGIARIVEIARTLAAGARVLLLDEPSSGMSEQQVREFADTVRALRDDGLSILLVEHDATLVEAVCDRVYELGLSRAGGWRPQPSTSG